MTEWPYNASSSWYTDSSFTSIYDFNSPVLSSFDLYLKKSALSSSSTPSKSGVTGVAYGNGKFYVTTTSDEHLYEYSGATGIVNGGDTEKITASYTSNPQRSKGVEYYNGFLYMLNTADDKIYAVDVSDFSINNSKTITLDGAIDNANDLVVYNDHFYIIQGTDKKVYVYNVDGTRDSSKDFSVGDVSASDSYAASVDNRAANNPFGICYADGYFYIVYNYREKVHAFKADTKAIEPSRSFDLNNDNTNPNGMTYKDGVFYVPDSTKNRVYLYKK